MRNKRIESIWRGMKQRCFNPNNKAYHRYGGRGITICKEWLADYAVFEAWSLSNKYSDDLSIDRINNDGIYEPQNCRWATHQQQADNTSRPPDALTLVTNRLEAAVNRFAASVDKLTQLEKLKKPQ